jgi:hypothetical protein
MKPRLSKTSKRQHKGDGQVTCWPSRFRNSGKQGCLGGFNSHSPIPCTPGNSWIISNKFHPFRSILQLKTDCWAGFHANQAQSQISPLLICSGFGLYRFFRNFSTLQQHTSVPCPEDLEIGTRWTRGSAYSVKAQENLPRNFTGKMSNFLMYKICVWL